MSPLDRAALTKRHHHADKPSTRRLTFSRNLPLFIFTLFTIPFVLVGIGLATTSVRTARRARATLGWTPTRATLRSCRVVEGSDSDGDRTYGVEVEYDYRVRGREYTSQTLTHRTLTVGGRDGAEALCARLSAESVLHAYVNPDAPDDAVLLTGGAAADYVGVVFGIVFAGSSLGMLLMAALMSGIFDGGR